MFHSALALILEAGTALFSALFGPVVAALGTTKTLFIAFLLLLFGWPLRTTGGGEGRS
jgi:hypothetical protein